MTKEKKSFEAKKEENLAPTSMRELPDETSKEEL
jgi:hypothetical protein